MKETEEILVNLNEMGVGESGKVAYVSADPAMRRRFFDLGLLPGTRIDCLMKKGKRGMRAYRIRNTVIALRYTDISNITVSTERS